MAFWENRVDIGDYADDALDFEVRRDGIVGRLRELGIADGDFADIVGDMADAGDAEEFDAHLDDLYDWADRGHRLWIDWWTSGAA